MTEAAVTLLVIALLAMGAAAFIFKEKIMALSKKTREAKPIVIEVTIREKIADILGISPAGTKFFEELEAFKVDVEANAGLWVRLKSRLGLAADTANKAVLTALFSKLDFADKTAEVVQAFSNLMNRPFASLADLKNYLNQIHHQTLGLVNDIAELLPKYLPYTGRTPFENDFAVVRAFMKDFRIMLNLWTEREDLIKDQVRQIADLKNQLAEVKELNVALEATLVKQTNGNIAMAEQVVAGLKAAAKTKVAKKDLANSDQNSAQQEAKEREKRLLDILEGATKFRGGNQGNQNNGNQGGGNRQQRNQQQPNNQPNQPAAATP